MSLKHQPNGAKHLLCLSKPTTVINNVDFFLSQFQSLKITKFRTRGLRSRIFTQQKICGENFVTATGFCGLIFRINRSFSMSSKANHRYTYRNGTTIENGEIHSMN
ncbi:hypothetical protein T07_13883 [Trichinella nelsoni]|uniref:Uncharacterized protein n=1 Tax=Trichinella nelsoni TaxID=6336 RepID=A0A0V0S9Y3_9BILA|nr:hypothetical protein T07_13883 [Trichinella nelsoni]